MSQLLNFLVLLLKVSECRPRFIIGFEPQFHSLWFLAIELPETAAHVAIHFSVFPYVRL